MPNGSLESVNPLKDRMDKDQMKRVKTTNNGRKTIHSKQKTEQQEPH